MRNEEDAEKKWAANSNGWTDRISGIIGRRRTEEEATAAWRLLFFIVFHLFLCLNMFFWGFFPASSCFLVSCFGTISAYVLLVTLISPHLSAAAGEGDDDICWVLLVIQHCDVMDLLSDSHAQCQQVCLFKNTNSEAFVMRGVFFNWWVNHFRHNSLQPFQ